MNQLSFVKIQEDKSGQSESPVGMPHPRRSGIPGGTADLPDEDTNEQVIANIREGVRQMRLVEQGKMKSRPAREFLNEL